MPITQSKHLPIIAAALIAGSGLASSARAITPVQSASADPLAAHRAVYDLKLEDSLNSANINGATGRMVFEVAGSKCEGYLVSMRFILSVTDDKGVTYVKDVRSSSWEDGEAQRFRFNTYQYDNQKLSKTTIGDAARKEKGEGISVNVKSPKQVKTGFDNKTYFPTEHTKLVLAAAEKGEKVVSAPLYDGSDNGNTLYETTTFIGKPISDDKEFVGSAVKNIEKLKGMTAWPVAISFFDRKTGFKQDRLPDYEISFNLYKNGVSTKLLIDYGDFTLSGKMKEIEFLPQTACPK